MTDARGESKGAAAALWVPSFDGVRGFVSLSILLVHVQLAINWFPNNEVLLSLRRSWFFSIEMLFLVGGFVALLPVVAYGSFPGARRYAIRRAGRLLPLYYLTIALAVLLGGLLRPETGLEAPHDVTAVLAHLVFIQHIVYPFRSGFGVHGVVWTLTIVACFYVFFAMLAGWYGRHPLIGLAVCLLIAEAWRTQTRSEPTVFLQFPLFLSDFGVGMTAAWAYTKVRRSGWRPDARLMAAAALGALALLGYLLYRAGLPIARFQKQYYDEGVLLDIAVPMAFAAFLIALPFTPRWFQWPFANRASRKLGDISYGLFLFHFLAIWLVLRYVDIPRDGAPASVVQLALLVFPITVTAAWLATNYVENPLRAAAQRFAERFARPSKHTATPQPEAVPPAASVPPAEPAPATAQ